MKTKRQLPRFIVFSLSMLLLFSQTVHSQSGTIDFEDSKWNSVIGHKLYRGGPNNTLTDSEMGRRLLSGAWTSRRRFFRANTI